MGNQMQHSTNKDLSLPQNRESGEDPYQINFTHANFAEALMENVFLPRDSTTNSITASLPIPRPVQFSMLDAKPRHRVYSSGSLSSTTSSFPIDLDVPMSLPINADTKEFEEFASETDGEIEDEDKDDIKDETTEEAELESTLKPLPPQESNFIFPARETTVKITISRGDFKAGASKPTGMASRLPLKLASKLLPRGLTRGFPLALSTRADYSHGQVPTPRSQEIFNSSPPKYEVEETTLQRFEEDLEETISPEKGDKMESTGLNGQHMESSVAEIALNAMHRNVSRDLSLMDGDKNNVVISASPHLRQVHERLNSRNEIHLKPAEKTLALFQLRRMGLVKSKSSEKPVVNELSIVFRATQIETIPMEATEHAPISGVPIKKQEPEVTTNIISTRQHSIQVPNTPRHNHRGANNLSHLHAARLQMKSPAHHPIISQSPSRAARELWRAAKTIHKGLSDMHIVDQRRELRDLRESVGLAPKDLSSLCDWQVETEYGIILKGLERRWYVKKKSLKQSISDWVEETQRECEIEGIGGIVSQTKEKSDTSAAVTDTDFESDDNSGFETIPEPTEQRLDEPSLPRTKSGRVHLPVIVSFDAIHPSPNTKPQVRFPVISGIDAPQFSGSKPRVRLPVIATFDAPQSPNSIARQRRILRRSDIPYLTIPATPVNSGPPKTSYIATQSSGSKVTGFSTPRRNRIVLHPSPMREAREVWNEARKRFRGLTILSVAQQRLELAAMRAAAGFPDRYVSDDKVVEAYRAEMGFLERKWMGKVEDGNEPSSSAVESGNWEILNESRVERDTVVAGEDDGDSDFETTMGSPSPTPIRQRGSRYPSRFGGSDPLYRNGRENMIRESF